MKNTDTGLGAERPDNWLDGPDRGGGTVHCGGVVVGTVSFGKRFSHQRADCLDAYRRGNFHWSHPRLQLAGRHHPSAIAVGLPTGSDDASELFHSRPALAACGKNQRRFGRFFTNTEASKYRHGGKTSKELKAEGK